MDLKNCIRTVPDYPKKGIMFRDITTLMQDATAFKYALDLLVDRYRNQKIDVIVGIESRGFILGSALAYSLGKGLVLVRKKGKLPSPTISQSYQLEYGTDTLEMHNDAIAPGQSVLLVDDLLATGGTVLAAANLVEQLGGKIFELAFIIDLPDLGGGKRLRERGYQFHALVEFEGD